MVRLAHLSDPHLGPLPRPRLRDLAGKRITGYLNHRGARARAHDMGTLAALLRDVALHAPDHIVVTGDLVNIGLLAEYPLAKAFLAGIGPPDLVSVVPGNHDAYVRGAFDVFVAACGGWMTGDGEARCGFPFIRRRGPVALVGASSGVATGPFLASGALGAAQRERLETTLVDLGREGAFRVLLIHHPPQAGGAKPGRNLTDAPELEALLARVGCELILHGHNHLVSVAHLTGPAGPIPILGAPSASARVDGATRRAGWFLIDIAAGRAAATLRQLNAAGDGFETAAHHRL